MCEPHHPDDQHDQPASVPDNLLIQAMAQYLDESLSVESTVRALLAKVGFNDPELPVEDCVAALVGAHLRLSPPT